MKNILIKSFVFSILTSSMIFFYACGSQEDKNRKIFENEENPKLIEKYKCENVDDCISKYQFEGARAYMAAEQKINGLGVYSNLPKITQAESIYLAKQNEFQKAIDCINEANHVNYYESDKQKLKYTIYEMAISKYCEDGDFKKAKIFALKASDIHNPEGYDKHQTHEWNEKETQQKLLLKKIKDFESTLTDK
jgi:tetratricopeptide (TPR) repeat protein